MAATRLSTFCSNRSMPYAMISYSSSSLLRM